MEGTLAARQLNQAGVSFSVAAREDDAELRALLRENPMAGSISISLEREPDYFADAGLPGERKQTILARDRDRVICAGCCVVRNRFINGRARPVGYLGGLRLHREAAGRFDILRRGYEFFHELEARAPADYYFTSIASDNARARAFLERGLRGMPTYAFVGEFVTLLIPSSGRVARNSNSACSATEIVSLLNEYGCEQQFAPCWTEDEFTGLRRLGLEAANFKKGPCGCGALWDQRAFKQTVVRAYSPALRRTRTLLNLIFRITRRPTLPPVGEPVSMACAAFLHFKSDQRNPGSFLETLLAEARRLGIAFVAIGLDARAPICGAIKKAFKAREYRSRIYMVRWPGLGGPATDLDGRWLGPELAFL